jgi:hypothetical protein
MWSRPQALAAIIGGVPTARRASEGRLRQSAETQQLAARPSACLEDHDLGGPKLGGGCDDLQTAMHLRLLSVRTVERLDRAQAPNSSLEER